MTRSKRKMPIRGIACCTSEKQDKRVANRKLRRKTNVALKKGDEILPKLREVSNVWAFGKDGKIYIKDMKEREKRK